MIVYAPEAVKPARTGDCGCGGKCGCESRCCDLECIVRPRFFCGQVLTDTDLAAAVDWAGHRLSLARYRHGWGVVCGLDVTCSDPRGGADCCPDPGSGPSVYVNPGYAMDCCGNDLVVCEPLRVDLGEVCGPLEDPCDPTWKPKKNGNGQATGGTADGGANEGPGNCWEAIQENVFTVQLWLRYHEDLAHGQRAAFRGGCSDGGACEYTRVLERPCVSVERLEPEGRVSQESTVWRNEFLAKSDVVRREIGYAFAAGADGLLRYLRRNPPHKFCFLHDLVCCLRPTGPGESQKALKGDDWLRVRLLIYMDWYLRQFECGCWSCKPDRGVPIGRVLLQTLEGRSDRACRVVMIDSAVPARRPLRKDPCRPVPSGHIDLSPWLWQPLDYARDALRGMGVTLKETNAVLNAQLETTLHNASLYVDPESSSEISAMVFVDLTKTKRIISFE
jgi:hypothetical protein